MLKFAVLALVFSPALAWYDFPFSPQKTRELMAALPSINLVAETSFFVLEVPTPSIMARSGVYAIENLQQMQKAIQNAAITGETNLEKAVQDTYDAFKQQQAAGPAPAGRKRRHAPQEQQINHDDYELMVQIEA